LLRTHKRCKQYARVKALRESGISLVTMSSFYIVPIISIRETSMRKRRRQREWSETPFAIPLFRL